MTVRSLTVHGLFYFVHMPNRSIPLLLFLVFLSCISGYLMSKASLAGRIGISLFYKEYSFLKTWWQGALVVLAGLIVVFLLLRFFSRRGSISKKWIAPVAVILLALIGFYLTWQDFHQTRTHKMLGERFHIGAYLFWVGWIVTAIFFLPRKTIDKVEA